jgi:hypothetical protein
MLSQIVFANLYNEWFRSQFNLKAQQTEFFTLIYLKTICFI